MKKKGQIEILIIVFVLLFVAIGIFIAFNWAWISAMLFSQSQDLKDIDQQITAVKKSYIQPAQKFSLMNTPRELGAHGGFFAGDVMEARKSLGGVPYWVTLDWSDKDGVSIYPPTNYFYVPFRIEVLDYDKPIGTIERDVSDPIFPLITMPYNGSQWYDEIGDYLSKEVLIGVAYVSCNGGSVDVYINKGCDEEMVYIDTITSSGDYVYSLESVGYGYDLDVDDKFITRCFHRIELRVNPSTVSTTCEVYLKQVVSSPYAGITDTMNKQMKAEMKKYYDEYDNPNKDTVGLYSDAWNSTIYPTGDGSGGVFWTDKGISAKKGVFRVKENYVDDVSVESDYWILYDYAEYFVENDFRRIESTVRGKITSLTDKREYKHQVSKHNNCEGQEYSCSDLIDMVKPIDFEDRVQKGLDSVASAVKAHYPELSEIEIKLKSLDTTNDPDWVGSEFWMERSDSWNTYSNLRDQYYECRICTKDCDTGNEYAFMPDRKCTNCYSYCEYYYAGYYTAEVRLISKPDITGDRIIFRFNVEDYFSDKSIHRLETEELDECYERSCSERCRNKRCCKWEYTVEECVWGRTGSVRTPDGGTKTTYGWICTDVSYTDYKTACDCTGKWSRC